MRQRLVSKLKASNRPGVWSVMAWVCRGARVMSRRRALWSYRLGYALERAGRLDEAGMAFTTACALAPGLTYHLPDPPQEWDRPAVAFARSLAGYGIRYQREGAIRDLLRRRGRVVPVVTRGTRRRWTRAAAHDCAARLHLLYLQHRDQYLPRYFDRSERYRLPRTRFSRAWRWYVADVLAQAIRLLWLNGRFVRQAAGVPVHRQMREVLWLSVTLPCMPENYYRYELYRPTNRARADQYLHGHENSPVLYEMLAGSDELAEVAPLTDKVAFAARAREQGLAAVPTLIVVEHGRVVMEANELPTTDLFVKPLAGKRGVGAQKWVYLAATDAYRLASGQEDVPRERFGAELASRSVGQAFIAQPCLTNHPELSDLALDAVVTCRAITMTSEAGEAELVIATFRMPAVRATFVDNMHRGGIAAPVALESGALGAASDYAMAGPAVRHSVHPVSGGMIEGRKLPLWEELRELVCRAHDSFRPRLLVGWDVCLTTDGPLLLEGNERPGVGGLQRLHDTPLGSHRFGELLAHHIERQSGTAG